jgi:hypothetical protein
MTIPLRIATHYFNISRLHLMNELLATNPGWEFEIGSEYVGRSEFKSEFPDFEIVSQYRPSSKSRAIRYAIYARPLSQPRAIIQPASPWVKITQGSPLPPYNVPVLVNGRRIAHRVSTPNRKDGWTWELSYSLQGVFFSKFLTKTDEPTHWMPLPSEAT